MGFGWNLPLIDPSQILLLLFNKIIGFCLIVLGTYIISVIMVTFRPINREKIDISSKALKNLELLKSQGCGESKQTNSNDNSNGSSNQVRATSQPPNSTHSAPVKLGKDSIF